MQALCAYVDMSIESGRESSIPEGFDTNNSPSVKFTLDVLDPMAKLLNAVKFRCNMRRCCERRGNSCLDARMSEASNIAPLIACVAKYAISRGNTFHVLNVGGTAGSNIGRGGSPIIVVTTDAFANGELTVSKIILVPL